MYRPQSQSWRRFPGNGQIVRKPLFRYRNNVGAKVVRPFLFVYFDQRNYPSVTYITSFLTKGEFCNENLVQRKWKKHERGCRAGYAVALGSSRHSGHDRHQVRLRQGALRRLYRASERSGRALLSDLRRFRRRPEGNDDRRPWRKSQGAEGLDRAGRTAMRLLPARPDDVGLRTARCQQESLRRRYRRFHGRQHLPLWNVSSDSRGYQTSCEDGLRGR